MLKQSHDSNPINQFKIFNIKTRGSIFISKIVVLERECEVTRKTLQRDTKFPEDHKVYLFFSISMNLMIIGWYEIRA
jgi:hypothetical protein